MNKIFFLLILISLFLSVGCSAEKEDSEATDSKSTMVSLPEGPLSLPAESDSDANSHNNEGISHYKEGHYEIALKHFRTAGKIKPEIGEIHFNEALALDKLGDHGSATKHFKVAQQNANGNTLILESKILLAHIQ